MQINHKTVSWIQHSKVTVNYVNRTVVRSDRFHLLLLYSNIDKLLEVSQLTVIIILIVK